MKYKRIKIQGIKENDELVLESSIIWKKIFITFENEKFFFAIFLRFLFKDQMFLKGFYVFYVFMSLQKINF